MPGKTRACDLNKNYTKYPGPIYGGKKEQKSMKIIEKNQTNCESSALKALELLIILMQQQACHSAMHPGAYQLSKQ